MAHLTSDFTRVSPERFHMEPLLRPLPDHGRDGQFGRVRREGCQQPVPGSVVSDQPDLRQPADKGPKLPGRPRRQRRERQGRAARALPFRQETGGLGCLGQR